MYDLRTYIATKDTPGGPLYIPEEQLVGLGFDDFVDDRPLTTGRLIGGVLSLILLLGTGAYLFLAL